MTGSNVWRRLTVSAAIYAILLGGLSTRTAADESIRILPLGDSITRGYWGSMERNGYRKPLHTYLTNRGYSIDLVGDQQDGNFADPNHEGHDGKTASWLNPGMDDRLWTSQPDVVLYHIGTNNLTGSNIETYAQDANETLEIIYDFDPNITVVLAKIILTRDDPARNIRTHNYNLLLEDIAQHWTDLGYFIELVDMENALNYPVDMADNLHPNDSGYSKMSDVWYAALDNTLAFAPVITSTPAADATKQHLYTYDVNADGCPAAHYTLITCPNNMTIDYNTGLIEWMPSAEGDFDVTVKAGNGTAPDANQTFIIHVSPLIKFDAAGKSSAVGSAMLSWPHTIGSGNNRILVVSIIGKDKSSTDLTVNSVTYNAVSMMPVAGSGIIASDAGGYIKAEMYYLLNANLPSASSYTVAITYNGAVDEIIAGAVSLANVSQQSPEAVSANSNIGSNISTNITPLTDDAWIVDAAGCSSYGTLTTAAEDMVQRWHQTADSSTASGSTVSVTSAQQTTMSWNHSGSGAIVQSLAAIAPAKCVISGYVTEPNGLPVEQVFVSADPNGDSDTTDPNGHYQISVPPSWSGTVTATKAQSYFKPDRRTYSNVTAGQSDQNYINISFYDLDNDGFIGWGDVLVMHTYWLETGQGIEGDFNDDGTVNSLDLAELALAW